MINVRLVINAHVQNAQFVVYSAVEESLRLFCLVVLFFSDVYISFLITFYQS